MVNERYVSEKSGDGHCLIFLGVLPVRLETLDFEGAKAISGGDLYTFTESESYFYS